MIGFRDSRDSMSAQRGNERVLSPAYRRLLIETADAGGELRAPEGEHEKRFGEAIIAAAEKAGLIHCDLDGPLGFMEILILTGPGWQAIGRQPPPHALALVWGWITQRTATRRSEAAT